MTAEEDIHISCSEHSMGGLVDLVTEVADGDTVVICISFADVMGSPSQHMKVHVFDPPLASPGGPTFYEHRADVS